jgi:hypothetical protein
MVLALRRSVVLLAFVALTGCGALTHEPAKQTPVTQDDLAVMVVPQGELGDGVEALEVDPQDSGPISAGTAADDTIDPKDTAKSLRHSGWTTGYELNYSDPKRAASFARRRGLVVAGSSVEAFETDSAARERLVKEIRDYERFEGKMIQGAKLEKFDTFDVAVGDEAWGVHFVGRVGKVRVYATGVFFRHGELLATAGILRADATVERGTAIQLARTLDERIERRLAGQLREAPVPLPAKPKHAKKAKRTGKAAVSLDPRPFTLTTHAFPGSTVVGEGYRRHGDVRSYLREFRLPGGRLGRSPVSYVRAMTQVLESPEAATDFLFYAESFQGSRELARTFVRGVLKSSPENLMAGPLPTRGGDTLALVSYFGPRSGGRLSAVMILVRSGRLIGSVTVVGKGNELNPKYVIALAPKLRAQLRAAG